MLTRSRPALPSLFIACVSGLASTCVLAQSKPLDEVVVVGSRIPQLKDQATPVTVITSEQLEQRGYATVQQALDDLSQNSGGGFDQQLNFGYTPSASSVNLRDMGVGRVLVMIDGRRMPAFPVGFNGTDSFVDLSSIPTGAVERIEVLADGASAIYGSDAMSGVINVVLKKHADTELTVRGGDTVHGGGAEKRVQFSTGAESDGSNALLFVEYYKRDVLKYSQREITRSDRLGGLNGAGPGSFSVYGYPGTFYGLSGTPYPAPGCGSVGVGASGFCEFDRAPYRQVWPDSRSVSATAKFDQQVTDALTWFTSMRLNNALTKMQTEPIAYNSFFDSGVITAASDVNNPVGEDGIFYRRLNEFGPQIYDYQVNAYSALTGLKGEFGNSFSWELGLQSARQRVRETDKNRVFADQMGEAMQGLLDLNGDGINDAPLNLFNQIPAYAVAQLSHQVESVATSKLSSVDFQLHGDLFALPAGEVKLATSAEYVKEVYDDQRDPEVVAGNVVGLGGTSGYGARERIAGGMELSIPVFPMLALNAAGRYDDYRDRSDVGGAFSPRLALEFRPSTSLLLRASAGRSFRAPDMMRMFGGDSTGFQDVIDTPQCKLDGGSGIGDHNVASCITPVRDVSTVTRANIALKEERGKNYSVGFFWKPSASFNASIDLFSIKLEDLVTTPDLQNILNQNALDGSNANSIVRDCTQVDNPGCLYMIDVQAQNVAYKKTKGLDAALGYALDVSGAGRFTLDLSATYLLDVEMRESIYREPVDVLRDGQLGESVRLKGGVQLGWQRKQWSANVFMNYIGSFTPLNTAYVREIGSFTTVNVSVNYRLPWQGDLTLGIDNVLDRQPPLDLQDGDTSLTFYHQQFHNVDGAKWFVGYRQKFGGG